MNEAINDLANRAGVNYFDYQVAALESASQQLGPQQRLCLYYKTGAGKSITALSCVALWGHSEALVITPPSTYKQWIALGERLGVAVECMSHAKFRMKGTKVSRTKPIVADEMHMFGGQGGQGWAKLDRLAQTLQAPLVLASATPNYNDAERVYCIQHVLDPYSCRGGYLEFLYANCETEQDPFSRTPKVTGFRNHADAADYLSSLPRVEYLPDDLVYTISDVVLRVPPQPHLDTYGYVARRHKIVASIIEEKHVRIDLGLVGDNGDLRSEAYDILTEMVGSATTPVLVFANHSTVADALGGSLFMHGVKHAVITGKTPAKKKQAYLEAFLDGVLDVLVGTASLATGTDGMDKVCDTMIILDDTEDPSLRRQLIGRIMPRGLDTDASRKQVYRILLSP